MFSALVITVNFRSGFSARILQPKRDILFDEKPDMRGLAKAAN